MISVWTGVLLVLLVAVLLPIALAIGVTLAAKITIWFMYKRRDAAIRSSYPFPPEE